MNKIAVALSASLLLASCVPGTVTWKAGPGCKEVKTETLPGETVVFTRCIDDRGVLVPAKCTRESWFGTNQVMVCVPSG